MMKKRNFITSVVFAILLVGTCTINAATYAQNKSSNVSAGGAKFRASEKATFNTTGNTRWSYSDKQLSYTGGTMYPINSNSNATTGAQYTNAGVYTTTRNHRITCTNQSYIDYTTTASISWTFNTNTNSFQ